MSDIDSGSVKLLLQFPEEPTVAVELPWSANEVVEGNITYRVVYLERGDGENRVIAQEGVWDFSAGPAQVERDPVELVLVEPPEWINDAVGSIRLLLSLPGKPLFEVKLPWSVDDAEEVCVTFMVLFIKQGPSSGENFVIAAEGVWDFQPQLEPVNSVPLPVGPYRTIRDDCSICLEILGAGSMLLGCGHRFHAQCLANMPMDARRCPECTTTSGFPSQTVISRFVELEQQVGGLDKENFKLKLEVRDLKATRDNLKAQVDELNRLLAKPYSDELLLAEKALNKDLWRKLRLMAATHQDADDAHDRLCEQLDALEQVVGAVESAVDKVGAGV
jgi:hypothetical protein